MKPEIISTWSDTDKPQLRPVQITPTPESDDGVSYVITDAQQLATGALTVSPPVLFILSLLDGGHTPADVCRVFQERVGQVLERETLDGVLHHLHQGHFLHGERFEHHYNGLVEAYAQSPVRPLRDAHVYGSADDLRRGFDAILEGHSVAAPDFTIQGLIAPHLDYPRGQSCYGAAYGALRGRGAPDRVIVLGTNHFGRSTAVCATAKDFQTPLGTVRCDRPFLELLESRCGNLRQFELDHAREHSLELQVLWLQHLFGSDSFRMVAILCPDPCGPTGTLPPDGSGVDLDLFNRELGRLIAEDPADTLLVAGADLSHVGTFFGEERPLTEELLSEVRQRDGAVLKSVERMDAPGLRRYVAEVGNTTNICSVGCIYSLLSALNPTRAMPLGYHQAVTWEIDNCVTCAAFAFGNGPGA